MFATRENKSFSKGREEFLPTKWRITNIGMVIKMKTLNPISFGEMY